jgi:integrase
MVGRRKKHSNLPARVYFKHGAFWFVAKSGKWTRLAADYPAALEALARMLSSAVPLATVETLWARYCAEELPTKAAKTARNRRQEMQKVLAVFGRMAPRDVKPSHVWEYWQTRGRTEQARHEVRAFSALLSAGVRWGALDRNPCMGLRLPGGGPRDRYVTDAEYLLVRELAPDMIGLAMDMALLTGARQGDILRLERRNLTADGVAFTSGKTDRAQVIEWNAELRAVVDECWRHEPRVRRVLICTRDGKPYSANGFQTAWQRLMAKAMRAGLAERFTVHDLRAKSLSEAPTLAEAQARAGHTDSRVTAKVYRRLPVRAPALSMLDKSRSS